MTDPDISPGVPDRFIIGTIGAPGEREFFLQIERKIQVSSYAIEKAQASALAERMKELLREIRRRDGLGSETIARDDGPLKMPVESEFRIVQMSLSWDAQAGSVVFEASGENDESTHVLLSPAQCIEFVRRTEKVVSAGRSPCPFCGLPLNLEGHLCPRANGYRR